MIEAGTALDQLAEVEFMTSVDNPITKATKYMERVSMIKLLTKRATKRAKIETTLAAETKIARLFLLVRVSNNHTCNKPGIRHAGHIHGLPYPGPVKFTNPAPNGD